MALFIWVCPVCKKKARKLADQRPESPTCTEDQTEMIPATAGSTSVMEVLDNGLMTKKLERPRDIVEMRHDHAQMDKPKRDEVI